MSARLRADERRDEVIDAATIEFAATGFAGTSTESIARRAGVSQPYLFQLFGTKKDLFLAAVRACFARTGRSFERAAEDARAAGVSTPDRLLIAMGESYHALLMSDRNLLRLQLHAYAACGDPDVQATVHDEFLRLWSTVADASGADPGDLHAWFAEGMLVNVIAAIGDARTSEEFDALMCDECGGLPNHHRFPSAREGAGSMR